MIGSCWITYDRVEGRRDVEMWREVWRKERRRGVEGGVRRGVEGGEERRVVENI